MPADFAISFAKGDAKIRPVSCVSTTDTEGGTATGVVTTATGSATGVGGTTWAEPLENGAAAAAPPPNKCSNASPALPMTTKGAPTSNLSPTFAAKSKVPDFGDSKSIVALSELISAKRSPFSTLSPTFLCHTTISPSSIESLKRGITITSAISVYTFWLLINNWICSFPSFLMS